MISHAGPISPKPRNEKAEAFAGAQRQRVEAECNAYLLSETRKAEARAATAQVRDALSMDYFISTKLVFFSHFKKVQQI